MVIEISLEEYAELQKRDAELRALEFAGVIDWEGYNQAMKSFWEEESIWDGTDDTIWDHHVEDDEAGYSIDDDWDR